MSLVLKLHSAVQALPVFLVLWKIPREALPSFALLGSNSPELPWLNSSWPVLLRLVPEVIRWHLQILEEIFIGLQLINEMYQLKEYMDYYLVTSWASDLSNSEISECSEISGVTNFRNLNRAICGSLNDD